MTDSKPAETSSAYASSSGASAYEPKTHNPFTAAKKSEGKAEDKKEDKKDEMKEVKPTESNGKPNTTTSNETEESVDNEQVAEAESTAEYEPVVKLEIVETKSGEENDEELYKQSVNCTVLLVFTNY